MKNMACPKKASPYIDVTSKITRYRGSASAITILSSAEVVRQVNTDASKKSLQNVEEESHDVADQIETGEIYKIFKGYCSFKIKITLNNYLNSQIQIPMNIKIKKKKSILLTVVPNSSQSSNDAVDSDSAVEFDQKLSAVLRTLGTRVIGEIAFQLERGIMETVFQPGMSPSNGQSKKKPILWLYLFKHWCPDYERNIER